MFVFLLKYISGEFFPVIISKVLGNIIMNKYLVSIMYIISEEIF